MANLRVYLPDGRNLRRFLHWDEPGILGIMGPWGSGKSSVCVHRIIELAKRQRPSARDGVRRSRFAIIRETVVEMRMTTMKTWWEWMPKEVGRWVDQGPPSHTIRLADPVDGSRIELEIIFLALDNPADKARLDSLELTGAWINEARHVDWENAQNVIGRTNRYPSMAEGGSAHGPCLFMDTNPPDPDHWWFQKFEDEQPEGWKLFKQPSGLSPEAENRKFLAPDYYEKLTQGMDKDWITVYVHGQYGYSKDGRPVYYGQYDDSIHCAGRVLVPDRGLPFRMGLDAGGTPAMVLGQRRPNGQWRWIDELVGTFGTTGPKRFGEDIRRLLFENYPGLRMEDIRAIADPSAIYGADTEAGERNWIETVNNVTGIDIEPAFTNNQKTRMDVLRPLFRDRTDGQPTFQLSQTMKLTRRGLANGYRYRRIQAGGMKRFTPEPEKNVYSHPCEALQYGSMGEAEFDAAMGRDHADRRGGMVANAAVSDCETDYDELEW